MNDETNATDLLLLQLAKKGAACSTVKDGHLLMFTRKFLQALLDAHPTKDEFVVFVERPDFKKTGS